MVDGMSAGGNGPGEGAVIILGETTKGKSARLGGFLSFHVGLLFGIVLGAELDHRSRSDGQCPVDGSTTANHGALRFCTCHFSTSTVLSSYT